MLAIGINSTAAVYTMSPSDFALPNFSMLADLVPHQKISEFIADLSVPASKAGPSPQQQHVAALQENSALLQQNATRLEQDSLALASLRRSVVDEHVVVKKISAQITDEHEDVKKISAQISTLISKVELAEECDEPGSDVLDSGQTRAQPAVPRHAQEAGPAADLSRPGFGRRRRPQSPGHHAGPAGLTTRARRGQRSRASPTYRNR